MSFHLRGQFQYCQKMLCCNVTEIQPRYKNVLLIKNEINKDTKH